VDDPGELQDLVGELEQLLVLLFLEINFLDPGVQAYAVTFG
jgi:hypothetical protein